jgi:hypothetical protein
MIKTWAINMILNDSNHVGGPWEARGGARRRGKPLLGGLLGTAKPPVAQGAGGIQIQL